METDDEDLGTTIFSRKKNIKDDTYDLFDCVFFKVALVLKIYIFLCSLNWKWLGLHMYTIHGKGADIPFFCVSATVQYWYR